MLDDAHQSIGRFDRSFLIHMIKEFFVILLVVTLLEFSLKAALVYYDFQTNSQMHVEKVAADIAENIETIMFNQGGPVAARTLYPILKRNWSELGYKIAIEPSEDTVQAIKQNFDFLPTGMPPGTWPDGDHKLAQIDIPAGEFCLSCHTRSKKGEILGSVTVRSYLASDFAKWWHDVKLSSALALGKIIFHSILLFALLRTRLEPLLRLRSVVSNLSRAYADLNLRAEIRSSDEFGALARDLNLFLDRISRLVAELDEVLHKIVTVNDDIIIAHGALRDHADRVISRTRSLERQAIMGAKGEPILSNVWFDTAKSSICNLAATLNKVGDISKADDLVENLRAVVTNAESQVAMSEKHFTEFAALGEETQAFQIAISEMTRLEERMKAIIETGTQLVRRLRPED